MSRGASNAHCINSFYGNGARTGQAMNMQRVSTPTQTSLQKRPASATQPRVLMKKVNNTNKDQVTAVGGPSVSLPAAVVENNLGGFISELDDCATYAVPEREDIV